MTQQQTPAPGSPEAPRCPEAPHRETPAIPPRRQPLERPPAPGSEFLRAANEDDDGYDPYSDRRPEPSPLFERDPWG